MSRTWFRPSHHCRYGTAATTVVMSDLCPSTGLWLKILVLRLVFVSFPVVVVLSASMVSNVLVYRLSFVVKYSRPSHCRGCITRLLVCCMFRLRQFLRTSVENTRLVLMMAAGFRCLPALKTFQWRWRVSSTRVAKVNREIS